MKFNSLVHATEAIWQVGYDARPTITRNPDTGVYEVKCSNAPSFTRSMDIVEACMALGVKQYLEEELRKRCVSPVPDDHFHSIFEDDDGKPIK